MDCFVKKSRHRYEWLFFSMATSLAVITFIVMLGMSFYKEETLQFIEQEYISEYRLNFPEQAEKMSEAEILAAIPEDDQWILETIRDSSVIVVLLLPIGFVLMLFYSVGRIYGSARSDGIKITARQFPVVYQLWEELAKEVGLKKTPELFVQNGNGNLNAFATCVPGYRSFGVIYSDILERALAHEDFTTLRFILGHELGHIRLGHVRWWYFLCTFLANVPGVNYCIGLPLSRAREYGCDKIGAHLAGDDTGRGLLILAAGKHLYQQVDLNAYQEAQIYKTTYWEAVNNFFADHPNINWRIAAIEQNRHGDLFFAKLPKHHK